MRVLAASFAVALAVALVPAGSAQADHGDQLFQSVAGEVILPVRFVDSSTGDASGGYPGVGRRLWLAYAGGTNNVVSDIFDIDPGTWGGRFDLTVATGVTGEEDLGIFFYTDFGTINAVFVGDPGSPCSVGEYDTVGVGGESGVVPQGATKAIVFMTTGLDAFFSYQAYSPPTVHITPEGFGEPLEVLAGQTVVWVNDDAAFHTVTSTAIDDTGEPLFDSSPNHPNQPIGQGSTYSVEFFNSGTWEYIDQYTEATGTVVATGTAPSGTC